MSNRGASDQAPRVLHGTSGRLIYGELKPVDEHAQLEAVYESYTSDIVAHLYPGIRGLISSNSSAEVPSPKTLVPPIAAVLARVLRTNAYPVILAIKQAADVRREKDPTYEQPLVRLLPATALERTRRHYYELARTDSQKMNEWHDFSDRVNVINRQFYPELDLAEGLQQQSAQGNYRDGAIGRLCGAFQVYGAMAILLEQKAAEERQAMVVNE